MTDVSAPKQSSRFAKKRTDSWTAMLTSRTVWGMPGWSALKSRFSRLSLNRRAQLIERDSKNSGAQNHVSSGNRIRILLRVHLLPQILCLNCSPPIAPRMAWQYHRYFCKEPHHVHCFLSVGLPRHPWGITVVFVALVLRLQAKKG